MWESDAQARHFGITGDLARDGTDFAADQADVVQRAVINPPQCLSGATRKAAPCMVLDLAVHCVRDDCAAGIQQGYCGMSAKQEGVVRGHGGFSPAGLALLDGRKILRCGGGSHGVRMSWWVEVPTLLVGVPMIRFLAFGRFALCRRHLLMRPPMW